MPLSRTTKVQWTILVVLLLILASILVVLVTGVWRLGAPGPGEATLDYLRGNPYPRMTIEIDYVPSAAPDSAATGLLRTRLLDVTDKSSVDVVVDDAVPAGDGEYGLDEISTAERNHRDRQTGGDTAVLYLLYLDGTFQGSEGALGVAYAATSVAVFKGRILDAAPPFPSPITARDIENSVLVHEVGHILGLVNLVYESAIPYEDPSHPGHSTNQSCVMYWAIEASAIGGIFSGPPPTDFGSEARDDLARLKSGAYAVGSQRAAPAPMRAPDSTARQRDRACVPSSAIVLRPAVIGRAAVVPEDSATSYSLRR